MTGYKIYYGSGVTPTNWTPAVFVTTNPPCGGYYTNRGSNFFQAYTNSVEFGNTLTGVVSNLVRGQTYFFSATAHDDYGLESDYSEEIKFTVPSTNYPFNFSVIIAKLNNKVVLQAKVCPDSLMTVKFSTNLTSTNWSVIATNAPADAYGNFIYTHAVPSAMQGYYQVMKQVWFTGNRIKLEEGERLPREERMKGYKNVDLIQYDYPFDHFGKGVTPVAIELLKEIRYEPPIE